ncbi:hypothetical protein NQZ79_g2145 [Umbelopsis isabellina]|nr:hypothetical protein NQZ79_g2145 [Umbelopsis isabellina]
MLVHIFRGQNVQFCSSILQHELQQTIHIILTIKIGSLTLTLCHLYDVCAFSWLAPEATDHTLSYHSPDIYFLFFKSDVWRVTLTVSWSIANRGSLHTGHLCAMVLSRKHRKQVGGKAGAPDDRGLETFGLEVDGMK